MALFLNEQQVTEWLGRGMAIMAVGNGETR